MSTLQWDDRLATNLPLVDDQHRKLVDLIGKFGDLLETDAGAAQADVDELLTAVADYAKHHFHDEEAMMTEVGVHKDYRIEHHQEHARFIEEVQVMGEHPAGRDAREAAKELQAFLSYWLGYHILGADQIMAHQVAAIRRGADKLAAYADRLSAHDPATALLLQSVDRLFKLVRERNRALTELNRTLEQRVEARTQELTDANRKLTEMALTDVLTGLPNRRQAMLHLQAEWAASIKSSSSMACVMIDADGFKKVNDTHGHDAGDEVLRRLARELKGAVRTDDVVYRLGGDEFMILFPNTPLSGAMIIAEKLRLNANALRVPVGHDVWVGSISLGVAERTSTMKSVDDLLKAADEALYVAKQQGRNRVAEATPV